LNQENSNSGVLAELKNKLKSFLKLDQKEQPKEEPKQENTEPKKKLKVLRVKVENGEITEAKELDSDIPTEPAKPEVPPPADPTPEPEVKQTEKPVEAPKPSEADLRIIMLEGKLAEIEKTMSEKVQSLQTENSKLKEQVDANAQKEKDAIWENVKKLTPPALLHGEKEAETRKLFETDPIAFNLKLLEVKQKQIETKEEGSQHVAKGGKSHSGPGAWNPYTQQFE
jgi:hypothetical protein